MFTANKLWAGSWCMLHSMAVKLRWSSVWKRTGVILDFVHNEPWPADTVAILGVTKHKHIVFVAVHHSRGRNDNKASLDRGSFNNLSQTTRVLPQTKNVSVLLWSRLRCVPNLKSGTFIVHEIAAELKDTGHETALSENQGTLQIWHCSSCHRRNVTWLIAPFTTWCRPT